MKSREILLRGLLCGLLCFGLMFAFTACEKDETTSPNDNQGNENTITGTVYLPDSLASYVVCIGTLEGFLDFWTDFSDTTLLTISSSYEGTAPIEVLNTVVLDAGETERTYSFDMPSENYENVDFVVAWVDKNEDSAIAAEDDGTGSLQFLEQARVPLKEYEGASYVIDFWGYMAAGDELEYLLFINSENLGLSIVGTSGFDFHFQ
ncbi:MAG: hypothetical protein V2A56_00495 [bacterium]